jgi:hypothetical protein
MSALSVHCAADRWDFDPRYTDGACPICGTPVEGAAAAPRWLRLSRRVPWDVVLLLALFLVLVVLAKLALHAAGIWPPVPVPAALRAFL